MGRTVVLGALTSIFFAPSEDGQTQGAGDQHDDARPVASDQMMTENVSGASDLIEGPVKPSLQGRGRGIERPLILSRHFVNESVSGHGCSLSRSLGQ